MFYLQELRLSSHVVSEFSNEGSSMSRDGDFATAWLKNPHKPMGPLMINSENGSVNDCNTFEFCAQQSSIPKAVLQQLGSSFLLRTTAWEMYGRLEYMMFHTLITYRAHMFLFSLSLSFQSFFGIFPSFVFSLK